MPAITTGDHKLIRAARALFMLNAAIWLVIGIVSVMRIDRSFQTTTALVIVVLMLGNAAAMLLAGWGIGRRKRLFYLFALAVLAVNIVLTFTDQFGPLDLLTLIIDVALVGLLIAARRLFWSTAAHE